MNTRVTPQDSVRLFLEEKRYDCECAETTLASYELSLGMFLSLPDLPETTAELSALHARQFTMMLRQRCVRGRRLSDGGVNAYQRPVWVWFHWLYQNDLCPEDITRKVRRVEVKNPKRRVVSAEIKQRMIEVALDRPEHRYRNAAIVEVLYGTAIRRTELAYMLLEDVDFEAGTMFVRHGKGGRERVIGINREARLALHRYITHERGNKAGPLFYSRTRKPMSSNAIRCVIRSLAESVGVEVASHDFRRAAAVNMRRDGMDLGHVRTQLGHTTEKMTLIYTALGEQEASLQAFHARDAGVRDIENASSRLREDRRKRGA